MNRLDIMTEDMPVSVFLPDVPAEGVILLPMECQRAAGVWQAVKQPCAALIAVGGFDWNRDLSPWSAQAVFPGEDDFSGGADAFLEKITGKILPQAEQAAGLKPKWRAVAGYSLAGLFAAYAVFRCAAFSRMASVSGSMWFDGWLDYAEKTPLHAPVERAYFSAGAKEKRTRNARMAPVEENTRRMQALFESRGARSLFELNPGNHFVDMEIRMAKAIDFLSK